MLQALRRDGVRFCRPSLQLLKPRGGRSAERWAQLSAGGLLIISASWYKGSISCEIADGAVSYGLRADGSYGPVSPDQAAAQGRRIDQTHADVSAGKLPEISLEEFQAHVTENSLWVTYGGIVFDVTSFAAEHPGGADALYGAGGQDLEIMWKHYPVHYNKPEVIDALAPYAIGTLSDSSMEALRDPRRPKKHLAVTLPLDGSGAYNHAVQRSRWRMYSRLYGLWMVTLTSSFWWWTRSFLRVLSRVPLIGPLAETCSGFLPCSVPGLGGAAPLPSVDASGRRAKVAVIGGGIAGCSCAFSLAESGYDVTVYESRKVLGGNAQLATFPVGKAGQEKMVSQDLSVLYWAPEFYRNYSALLQHLGVKAATVELPYVIHTNIHGTSEFYTQPGSASGLDKMLRPSLEDRYAADFRCYDRMISCIGKINALFRWGSSRTSFYETNQVTLLPFFSPLNYVGLRTASRLFGCSDDFWNNVIKPFHGLNLSTVHIDGVPGTAFEILDAISPLHRSRKSRTWDLGNSQEVFQRATAKCSSVKLDTRVRQVHFEKECGKWKQVVIDDHGQMETFDRVVLACPASAASNIIRPMSWMEQNLLRAVEYHDEVHHSDWKDWLDVPVHQDTTCLPAEHHGALLEHAAFLIDVDSHGREGGNLNIEYTHNLGAFSPSARSLGVAPADCPMFMTQCQHQTRTINPSSVIQSFSAPRGHPCLSTHNMIVTQMLHLVQGRRGIYYCSNWTSPGNGHDLACTSGLAVASAIGAAYPLRDDEARRDHRDCRRFMWI